MVERASLESLYTGNRIEGSNPSVSALKENPAYAGFLIIKMTYTVCAISSINRKYIHVGLTSDLTERLHRHNSRYEKTIERDHHSD